MLCRGYHGLLANIYLNEFDQKMDRRGVYTRVHRNSIMKRIPQRWNEWLRCRICIYIWKQWKNPKIRGQNLKKLGIPEWQADQWGAGLGYWKVSNTKRSGAIPTKNLDAKASRFFSFIANSRPPQVHPEGGCFDIPRLQHQSFRRRPPTSSSSLSSWARDTARAAT